MSLNRTLLALAFAATMTVAAHAQSNNERYDAATDLSRIVSIEVIDGDPLCTVVVEDESIRRVLNELAGYLEVQLLGFDGVQRTALVTTDLRRRPVRQVLEFLLGSVGLRAQLRADTLTVVEDKPLAIDRGTLLQIASANYLRAQTLFPGHPLAASARISQGRLEELRENWTGAMEHYHTVAENYSTSEECAESLFRAGLMNERMSQWPEANLLFRQLVNLPAVHDFEALGRVELARCLIRTQDYSNAIHLLKVLSDRFPPRNIDDARTRDLLGAEALIGTDDYIQALRKLERLENSGLDREDRLTVHSLRAAALEGLEMRSEAGRAWLIYAKDVSGAEHSRAIEKAVRLAWAEQDDLSVLFAAGHANDPVLDTLLAPFINAARENLGLPHNGRARNPGST